MTILWVNMLPDPGPLPSPPPLTPPPSLRAGAYDFHFSCLRPQHSVLKLASCRKKFWLREDPACAVSFHACWTSCWTELNIQKRHEEIWSGTALTTTNCVAELRGTGASEIHSLLIPRAAVVRAHRHAVQREQARPFFIEEATTVGRYYQTTGARSED